MPSKTVHDILERLGALEKSLENHLIESGEIRNDLSWVKKGVWVGAGAGLTFVSSVLIALLVYLLNR